MEPFRPSTVHAPVGTARCPSDLKDRTNARQLPLPDCDDVPVGSIVEYPSREGLQIENLMTPRAAFFAETEQVPVEQTAGRVCGEMLSPYPPSVPVLVPGELISQKALDHLTTGVRAGLFIADTADPEMNSIRVVAS
jgi:arginine decarboxylase